MEQTAMLREFRPQPVRFLIPVTAGPQDAAMLAHTRSRPLLSVSSRFVSQARIRPTAQAQQSRSCLPSREHQRSAGSTTPSPPPPPPAEHEHRPAAAAAAAAATAYKYPTSLNIFHAGTGLTCWIGTCKLFTIMHFAFQCLVLAPSIPATDPSWHLWTCASVLLGAAPLALTQRLTGPFVASINVRVPPAARKDGPALGRWSSADASGDTLVELTTLRFMPWPKRNRVRLRDLRVVGGRTGSSGAVDLEYVSPSLRGRGEGKGKGKGKGWWEGWWLGLLGGRRRFHVREGSRYTKTTRGPGVWEDLLAVIRRQSGSTEGQTASRSRCKSPRKAARQKRREA